MDSLINNYFIVNSTYFTDWRYETFTERYSFGNVLAQYELWVQNVSDITPRIKCKDQQVFMSDYQFESDKMNVPQTQGDGGYLEEVWTTWEDHSRVRCTDCINVLSIWDTDSLFQGVFYGHVKFYAKSKFLSFPVVQIWKRLRVS